MQVNEFSANLHDCDVCPECGLSWRGEPIPQEYIDKGYYGPPETASTHYSLLIGVELAYDDPNHYDGVSYWLCPHCGATWDRFSKELVKGGKQLS